MTLSTTSCRETKYCYAIRSALEQLGHGTNAQIAAIVRTAFPKVSDTTIHRATARLARRGEIATAPKDASGAIRYDALTCAHDHFMCQECGSLRDIDILDDIQPIIKNKLGGQHITSRIVISGMCDSCMSSESHN